MLVFRGGRGLVGGEGVVVLICPPNGVASLGVAVGVRVWACWMDSAVPMFSGACGLMGLAYAHNPGCVCRVVLGLLLPLGGGCGGCV